MSIELMKTRDRVVISIFIAAYLLITLIAISADCPLKNFIEPHTRKIQLFLGIDQSWRMFCPNPRGFCFHPYAVITFQDGSTAYYEFPRPDKMNQLNAFMRERER